MLMARFTGMVMALIEYANDNNASVRQVRVEPQDTSLASITERQLVLDLSKLVEGHWPQAAIVAAVLLRNLPPQASKGCQLFLRRCLSAILTWRDPAASWTWATVASSWA